MTTRDPFTQKPEDANAERLYRRFALRLKEVAQTSGGREFIECVLEMSNMNTLSFNANALTMAFNEGRRSLGLDISRMIDPDSYQLILKEGYERRRIKRH